MKCFANLGLCAAATADCAADCGDDTCYQATCEPTYTIPPQGLDDLVGGYTELSQTPNGLLAVYFDKFQDSAKWVRQSAGTWGTPVAIGATTGPFASGVVDTNGDVYLAYQDRANKRLVFDANGTIEVIQDGVRDTATWWIVNDIGEDVQLRQNGAGNFVVVYQDATEHILHRAERMAADAWNVGSLGLPGDPYTGAHGFYLSMLKDAATDTLVETVINSQLETPTGNPVLYE